MKIAFLIYQYCNYEPDGRSAGGVERYVSDLSKAFVEAGHEIHLFCHKIKGPVNENLQFHHVPALGFWSPLKIWSFAINSMIILKLRQKEFDIIQSFGKTLFQDVLRLGGGSHFDFMKRTYPLMANPFLRFIVIANPRHFFNLLLEWATFRSGGYKRLVCISNMCKLEYMEIYKISEEKISVIYNGVNSDKFAPKDKKQSKERLYDLYLPIIFQSGNPQIDNKKDEILLLFAGSGFKRKGLKHVITALSMLKSISNVRLIVAGNGKFESYLKIAQEYNVAEKVTYIGMVSNMFELYDACDIFIFPTNYDAFGNVCLEAMAMELPVIVSKSAGSAEIVENNKDGFVIDYPIKAENIAKHIDILADKELRINMGKLARKKALNFPISLNSEKTLQLYSEIYSKK